MGNDNPAIQLIAHVVATDADGRILLARYGDDADAAPTSDDVRWWLPAGELEPYEHPDAVARRAIEELGVQVDAIALASVDSFRGRRGWHVMFDYRATVSGEPTGAPSAAWHPADQLPAMAHGNWERDTITRLLAR